MNMKAVAQDLRFVIGTFFAILGVVLIAVPGEHAPLTTGPVNAEAGACILAFGALMLWLAIRGRKATP